MIFHNFASTFQFDAETNSPLWPAIRQPLATDKGTNSDDIYMLVCSSYILTMSILFKEKSIGAPCPVELFIDLAAWVFPQSD